LVEVSEALKVQVGENAIYTSLVSQVDSVQSEVAAKEREVQGRLAEAEAVERECRELEVLIRQKKHVREQSKQAMADADRELRTREAALATLQRQNRSRRELLEAALAGVRRRLEATETKKAEMKRSEELLLQSFEDPVAAATDQAMRLAELETAWEAAKLGEQQHAEARKQLEGRIRYIESEAEKLEKGAS
jgi:chromosome segregation ATPase